MHDSHDHKWVAPQCLVQGETKWDLQMDAFTKWVMQRGHGNTQQRKREESVFTLFIFYFFDFFYFNPPEVLN